MDQLLGQDNGPRVWRVYTGKKKGIRGKQQGEEAVMQKVEKM